MNQLQSDLPEFSPLEEGVLRLRGLYEQAGFQPVELPTFEDYSLYLNNKHFLDTDRILTFPDPEGRLLALKADVTLSIARKIPAGSLSTAQKLYYLDEVVRFSPENQSYRVEQQIGLEWIGREDSFANLEVLDLALRSLALLGEETAMDVSHLGFVSGLLEDAGLPPPVEREILTAIHAKSIHDIAGQLDAAGVSNGRRERILALAGLHGPFQAVLFKAKELVRGSRMEQAYQELAQLGEALSPAKGQALHLDFSVVNHLDYYNGIIFRGYRKDIPSVVCGGGRYDHLMHRLGKDCGAIGFAIYLHPFDSLYGRQENQVDILLVYPVGSPTGQVLRQADTLRKKGLRVRCEREDGDWKSIPCDRIIRWGEEKSSC